MSIKEMKKYKRDALFGALGAFLMLIGDLCLSVIPASQSDSGLFAREAYLNGSWEQWRLPLLIATGLFGMALVFLPYEFPTGKLSRNTARHEWRFL